MRWPGYPSYKPSGLPWCANVPTQWEVGAVRRFAQMRTGHTPSRSDPGYWEDCNIPWFTLADVWQLREARQKYLGETAERISELGLQNSAAEVLPAGTVVLSRTASVGFSGIMPSPMATSQDFWNWIPGPKLLPEYLLYSFRAMSQEFQRLTMGSTHQTIYQPDAARLSICVPQIREQRSIVAFLDQYSATIDLLTAKRRAVLERLKEQRAAVVSRTVTRGLPPEAARAAGLTPQPKLKASGVPWLGDVPEHWAVKRIKYLARVESGHTPARSVDEYWSDCTIPWVSLNDSGYLRTHDYISETAYEINELGLANSSARLLPAGAVVFSRDASVGLCAITTKPMTVSQHFVAYICGSEMLPEYLLYSLKAMGQHLEALSLGATIPTIGMADVRSLACALPPLPEQRAISEYIGRETRDLGHRIRKTEAAIELLREYRTALITAAVTGKIDVRDHVVQGLPAPAGSG